MKSMSITKVALLGLIIFSANIFAKTTPAEKRFADQMEIALTSNNPGVVESSIFISLAAKNYFPELNFSKIVNKLNDLVADGSTPVIKYKAQLAAIYYSYPELFSDIKINTKESPDASFKLIAERLVNNSLASN
jgi:hypothetical protein